MECKLLGGVANILQVHSLLNRNVHGFRRLESALKAAVGNAKGIESKLRRLNQLHVFDGLQSEILREAELEFEGFREELIAIQDKVVNRSHILKLLMAPEILEQLN